MGDGSVDSRAWLFRTLLLFTLAVSYLSFVPDDALAIGPPIVSATSVSDIREGSVTFEATVNPNGRKTTEYHFEYVDQTGFEASGFTSARRTLDGVPLPETNEDFPLEASVTDLIPGTRYHVRAFASNAQGNSGKTQGTETIFATYAARPVFPACPNDAFRVSKSTLPDCRAYEQASPVDKNGSTIEGIRYIVEAAKEGGAVSFYLAGGIPGGSGSQSPPVYVARRSEGAWATHGLLPPPSFGSKTPILGWTPDLSQVFIEAIQLGSGSAFLRSSPGGVPEKLVNYAESPIYAFVYATPDGSKVFFEAQGADLAPGAASGRDNFYVWSQESNAVQLVGVLPNGSTPSGGSFAGPYDFLEGDVTRGGSLASYYVEDTHAVSEDGKRAFFTIGGGQLYLRNGIGGSSVSSEHVSGSQRSIPDPLGTRPAIFMGASANGAKSFFLSSEKLTNESNTGPEPPPPSIGRAKLSNSNEKNEAFIPMTVASGLAVLGEYVYWANSGAGAIGRAKLDNSGTVSEVKPEFISGAEVGTPSYVAVDSEHIYWTNTGDGTDHNGTIGRAEINGTKPVRDFITGASNPQGIGINDTRIYWANTGETDETKEIGCADIEGNGPDQQCIEISPGNYSPQGLAVDGSHVYWSLEEKFGASTQEYVRISNLDGSQQKTIFLGQDLHVRGVTVNGSHVYWAEQGAGQIGRANLELGGLEQSFMTAQGALKGIALDGEHVYWSANGDVLPNPGSDLYRYEVGGALSDLTYDPNDKNGAEVKTVLGVGNDGSHIYFLANAVLSAAPNSEGESAEVGSCIGEAGAPSDGVCNLYLWEEGAVKFIAQLDAGDDAENWEPSKETAVILPPRTSRVSENGGVLLFRSKRKLSAYENEGIAEIYRYEAITNKLLCISCNPTGASPVGAARLQSIKGGLGPGGGSRALNRNLSEDGRRIVFETPDKLVGTDSNGEDECPVVPEAEGVRRCQDVYEWEAAGAGSCESKAQNGGCLYLISTGKSPEPSFLADASASGDDALFFTGQQLVGQDRDALVDIYDARRNGGLVSQYPPPQQICGSIEACHGPPEGSPSIESPGSATVTGRGDPKPNRHAKHRRHKKKHKRSHAEWRTQR